MEIIDIPHDEVTSADINPEADLKGGDLSESMLVGVDLSGADLRGADLSQAELKMANLSKASLSNANLSETNLGSADLSGVDLRRANLSGANLLGANISNLKLDQGTEIGWFNGLPDASGAPQAWPMEGGSSRWDMLARSYHDLKPSLEITDLTGRRELPGYWSGVQGRLRQG